MRRILGKTLRTCLRALAILNRLLPKASGARIITYHSVRPNGGTGPRSSYVDPNDFSRQMEWLVDSGYQVVPLSRLVQQLESGGSVSDRWLCITFDDGYADNYIHAFPVLRRYGFPATIFLVTGKIGQDPEFLDPSHLTEMATHGIEFGGHTVDHVSLSSVEPEEARRQIFASRDQLERLSAAPLAHFCYPFGHFNQTVEGFVREAGYRSSCLEQAGPISPGTDPLRLTRVGVLGTDTLRDFALKVQGSYDWWINTYMLIEEWRRRKRGG
ncbi:MAG TPA: polysaccharide deacetylase family protein [Symbiobacteriaceae bacterium]|nr:polysaccharide deacetylase family protein [Symbiobacteriaceae bacterium]